MADNDRSTGDHLFDPPIDEWTRLSPRYIPFARVGVLISWAIIAIILGVAGWIIKGWWLAAIAVSACVVLTAFLWVRAGRVARSWGYAERDTDLYIRHGLWFKSLTVIPYGRMQAVTVQAGPIMRKFGLAKVQLVTATLQSDATIPGLDADAAEVLRDRLTLLGEQQAAAL